MAPRRPQAAEDEVLADRAFPETHRIRLCPINPSEQLCGEVRRRTNVVGSMPDVVAVERLVATVPRDIDDECQMDRRHVVQESMQALRAPKERQRLSALLHLKPIHGTTSDALQRGTPSTPRNETQSRQCRQGGIFDSLDFRR